MCQSGQYKQGTGSASCQSCPSGKTTPPGATAQSECALQCSAGSFGPDGGPCELCANGKYKDQPGTASCTNCPAHSSSTSGSTAATDCKCNKGYTGPDGASCTACGRGTFKALTGSDACMDCSSGKYSNVEGANVADTCQDCATGTYSAASAAFTCDSCGAGETTEDVGKTSRADCVCQQGFQRACDSPDVGTEGAFCTACDRTQLFKNLSLIHI